MAQTSEELKTLAELHEAERAVRTFTEHQAKRIGELERSREKSNSNFSKLEVKLDNLKNDIADLREKQESVANQLQELKSEVRGISRVLARSFPRESESEIPESSEDQPVEEPSVCHPKLKNPEEYHKLEAEEVKEGESFKFDISEEGLQIELRNYSNAEPRRQQHFLLAIMTTPVALASALAFFFPSFSTLTSVITLAIGVVGFSSLSAAISLIEDEDMKIQVRQYAKMINQALSESRAAEELLGSLPRNIIDSVANAASVGPKTE